MKHEKTGIGAAIKAALEKRGQTQKEFAEEIGYSHESVKNWVSEVCLPPIPTLVMVCRKLDISLDEACGLKGGKVDVLG